MEVASSRPSEGEDDDHGDVVFKFEGHFFIGRASFFEAVIKHSGEVEAAGNEVAIDSGDDFFALLANEGEIFFEHASDFFDERVEMRRHDFGAFGFFAFSEVGSPGFDNGFPA